MRSACTRPGDAKFILGRSCTCSGRVKGSIFGTQVAASRFPTDAGWLSSFSLSCVRAAPRKYRSCPLPGYRKTRNCLIRNDFSDTSSWKTNANRNHNSRIAFGSANEAGEIAISLSNGRGSATSELPARWGFRFPRVRKVEQRNACRNFGPARWPVFSCSCRLVSGCRDPERQRTTGGSGKECRIGQASGVRRRHGPYRLAFFAGGSTDFLG